MTGFHPNSVRIRDERYGFGRTASPAARRKERPLASGSVTPSASPSPARPRIRGVGIDTGRKGTPKHAQRREQRALWVMGWSSATLYARAPSGAGSRRATIAACARFSCVYRGQVYSASSELRMEGKTEAPHYLGYKDSVSFSVDRRGS